MVTPAGALPEEATLFTTINALKLPVEYMDWDPGTNTSRDFIRIQIIGTMGPIEGVIDLTTYSLHTAVLGGACFNLSQATLKAPIDLIYDDDTLGQAFSANGTICYSFDVPMTYFINPIPAPASSIEWSPYNPRKNFMFPAFKVKHSTQEFFGDFVWSMRYDYISAAGGKAIT